MAKYTKYLNMLEKLDQSLDSKGMKLLEGKVTRENLEFLHIVLSCMEKAWCVAWLVDKTEDIAKAGSQKDKTSGMPEEEDKPQGKDFRRGHQDTKAQLGGGHTAGNRAESGSAYGASEAHEMKAMMEDMRNALDEMRYEEARRGRSARTGRFVHRAESREPDEESAFWWPGFMPFYGRMGYGANPHENSPMYAVQNGIQVPVQTMGTSNASPSMSGTLETSSGIGSNTGTNIGDTAEAAKNGR